MKNKQLTVRRLIDLLYKHGEEGDLDDEVIIDMGFLDDKLRTENQLFPVGGISRMSAYENGFKEGSFGIELCPDLSHLDEDEYDATPHIETQEDCNEWIEGYSSRTAELEE